MAINQLTAIELQKKIQETENLLLFVLPLGVGGHCLSHLEFLWNNPDFLIKNVGKKTYPPATTDVSILTE